MLDRRSKKILLIFGAGLLIILFSELLRPRPINWRPSYTSVDKIPFGGYVLFEELETIFNDTPVTKITKDPYEFLLEGTYQQSSAYVFINDEVYFDKQQLEKLSEYVALGNTAFVSSRAFSHVMLDSLGVLTTIDYEVSEPKLDVALYNPAFRTDSLPQFTKGVVKSVFEEVDTLNTKALGYFQSKDEQLSQLNFVKVSLGKGQFLFHTLPETFSNYYLLNGNEQYAAQVLSYIDADHIYWDGYLKSGKRVITSQMRFIFAQPSLTWAYYVAMLGILLLIIFRGKREQRIIEVVKPLANTSVAFTRTIGDLYFQHKDYSNLISKKILYFMETVRSHYYLNTQSLDKAFIEKLALKSGNSLNQAEKLIGFINHLKNKTVHSEAELIELNKLIQDFKI